MWGWLKSIAGKVASGVKSLPGKILDTTKSIGGKISQGFDKVRDIAGQVADMAACLVFWSNSRLQCL